MYSDYDLQNHPRPMDFYGDILRHHREQARLTAKQVSERLELDLSRIYKYERGEVEPTFEVWAKMENLYRGIVREWEVNHRKFKEMGDMGLLVGRISPDIKYYLYREPCIKPYTKMELLPVNLDDYWGETLRAHRLEAGLTIEELGMRTITHPSQISRYENRVTMPSIQKYCILEDATRGEVWRNKNE